MAIIVATIVFAWQKRQERKSELLAERRRAFVSFLSLAIIFRNSIKQSGLAAFSEHTKDFHINYYSLWMIAPDTILTKLLNYEDALLALKKNLETEGDVQNLEMLLQGERDNFFDLLFAMRDDVQNQVSKTKVNLDRERL